MCWIEHFHTHALTGFNPAFDNEQYTCDLLPAFPHCLCRIILFFALIMLQNGPSLLPVYLHSKTKIPMGPQTDELETWWSEGICPGRLGLSLRIGKNMGLQTQYNLPLIVDSQNNVIIRGNRFSLSLTLYIKEWIVRSATLPVHRHFWWKYFNCCTRL